MLPYRAVCYKRQSRNKKYTTGSFKYYLLNVHPKFLDQHFDARFMSLFLCVPKIATQWLKTWKDVVLINQIKTNSASFLNEKGATKFILLQNIMTSLPWTLTQPLKSDHLKYGHRPKHGLKVTPWDAFEYALLQSFLNTELFLHRRPGRYNAWPRGEEIYP